MHHRFSWKRAPRPTGLAGACAGRHRTSWLRRGTVRFACVSHTEGGWYYVIGWDSDLPLVNTCHTPLPDEAAAKKEAKAHVLRMIAAAEQTGGRDGG